MDHDILFWIKADQDYITGLALIDRYGHNLKLSRMLRIGGATVKNRLTLAYELNKIARQSMVMEQGPGMEKPPQKQDDKKQVLPPVTEAVTIDKLKAEQKMCYKMLDSLHAMLPYRELEERRSIAFQILDIDDRLKELSGRIGQFNLHGVIIPEVIKTAARKSSEINTGELIKRQMTLRTYITRYKRILQDSESLKKRDKYQQLLDKYQLELDDINKQLEQ